MKRLVAFLLPLCAAAAAHGFVVTPPGLLGGDQFRYAFVTSTFTDATSDEITTYNGVVQDAADNSVQVAALGLTWSAIASTSSIDARDNTNTNPNTDGDGVPIFLLNGVMIADGNNDLWDGSLNAPLNLTEFGATLIGGGPEFNSVWTGTDTGGAATAGPLGSTETFGASFGEYSAADAGWVLTEFDTTLFQTSLYAISEIVTVPEPTSLLLVVVGGLLLAGRRR